MTRIFGRLRYIFIGLFAVLTAAVWIYQIGWVAPARRCEAARNWWDAGSRTCGHVVFLPDITHRPIKPQGPGAIGAEARKPA